MNQAQWPVYAYPEIRHSGRFMHDDQHFRRAYTGQPLALHCYEYEAVARIDGVEHALRPGDITVTAASNEVRYHLPRPGRHLCIHFGPSDSRDGTPANTRCGSGQTFTLPSYVPGGARTVEGIPYQEAMLWVLNRHAMAELNPLAGADAALGLQRLLLSLADAGRRYAPDGGDADPLDHAAAMLRSRLDEVLSVPRLADAVGLSQNYLARRFKQRFGVTIPRYRLRRRMEYAMLLLTSTDLSIGEIGVRVGLADPQHFNKRFRSWYEKSPTAARCDGRC